VKDIEQPVPQTIAAIVLVELVIELNALELPEPQAAPESTATPRADHCIQWPEVIPPLKITKAQLISEVQPVPPFTCGRTPLKAFAVMLPLSWQELLQIITAVALVPPVTKAQLEPPAPVPQGAPASPIVVEVKNLAQSFGVGEATIRACCMYARNIEKVHLLVVPD
jgi:hypothetical protein